MGLKDMASLYDRNVKDNLGPNVGTTLPSDGTYFTDMGSIASPYDVPLTTAAGDSPQSDQLVELLNNTIETTTGNTYVGLGPTDPGLDLPGIDIVNSTPAKYEDNPPT